MPPTSRPPVERKQTRARRGAVLAAFAGALLAAGCSRSGGTPAASLPAVPVQVGRVVRRTLPLRQFAIGTVQSLRSVAIQSRVDGVIDAIHFREGQDVTAGDLLVTLDRRPFENALRIARADLVNAEAQAGNAAVEAARYQQLDQQQAISKEQLAQLLTDVDTTRAQVQSKQAAVANAELQLGYTEIRAPIGGRTGQLNLHEGALVKANDNSFTIVTINQLAPISVAYAVPQQILPRLRAARTAGPVTVDAISHQSPPQTSEGRLEFIDNTVDPTTGMILAKADFANEHHTLWPGESVDVETLLGEDPNVLLVPDAAVQTGQDGSQVYVVNADRTVELRPVKIGRTAEGLTIVLSGLKDGETVVTDGQLRLVPGARVELTTLNAAAAPTAVTSAPGP